MKFKDRKKYYGLAILDVKGSHMKLNPIICSNCKYFETYYDSEYGTDIACTHPLEKVFDYNFESVVSSGSDCWGFRPKLKFEETFGFLQDKISIQDAEKAVDDFQTQEVNH